MKWNVVMSFCGVYRWSGNQATNAFNLSPSYISVYPLCCSSKVEIIYAFFIDGYVFIIQFA